MCPFAFLLSPPARYVSTAQHARSVLAQRAIKLSNWNSNLESQLRIYSLRFRVGETVPASLVGFASFSPLPFLWLLEETRTLWRISFIRSPLLGIHYYYYFFFSVFCCLLAIPPPPFCVTHQFIWSSLSRSRFRRKIEQKQKSLRATFFFFFLFCVWVCC